MKKTIWALTIPLSLIAFRAFAELQMPGYAGGGDLKSDLESTGQNITEVASLAVAIIAIIGMTIGGGYFAFGNGDMGKRWLMGGGIGLFIAGSVAGIASLFA